MDPELRDLVVARLKSDGHSQKPFAGAVIAAFEGKEVLDAFLNEGKAAAKPSAAGSTKRHSGAYLTTLTVEGFRGIGSSQSLTFDPGPGLTLIVGRNGSGKSSFAEGIEVLFTGDSKRWSERSRIWKEGWRSLHQPHPTSISCDLLLEGQGQTRLSASWDKDAALESQKTIVQPKGKTKTTLKAMGWSEALVSYRPFLSYNELGSMLDEGPSKLYDALSQVLGLEALVVAQDTLSKARLERDKVWKAANEVRLDLIEHLKELLAEEHDDRAATCLEALTSKDWGLDKLASLVGAAASVPEGTDVAILALAAALEVPGSEAKQAAVEALRKADADLEAVAGTDADRARTLSQLLQTALTFHQKHESKDCPVCGTAAAIGPSWREATKQEIDRLSVLAAASERAHKAAEAVRKQAQALLTAPPKKLFDQLFEIGLEGLDVAKEEWALWHAGATLTDLKKLSAHLATRHPAFFKAIETLKASAAKELQRRQDRWKPIAEAVLEWLPLARRALRLAQDVPIIKQAEAWLKDAVAVIRNQRFAPIADQAMAMWAHLRQNSNVQLGRIELEGAKTNRRVTLDVTVDGVAGAALGVMSQGELHSLALSLFLPRATLPESPFRFIVIDDPVQSMDPARVDGLAKALEDVARARQVIVFTHDERLPEAVRRLGIKANMLSVTRRPKSTVEVRKALDPVRAHIEDALALVHTTGLPRDILQNLVPGFCRSALEASFIQLFRRRRLLAGESHADIEKQITNAGKITLLAALALFDDRDRGGDVMKRLNQFGPWAGDVFRQCKDGAHEATTADLNLLINDTEKLSQRVLELK